jgi:hypothetical protein
VRIRDAWPWPGAPARPIVETDDEGRFVFTGLPSDHFQVFADAGSGEVNVAWYLLPAQDPVDLTLKPAEPKVTPPGAVVVRVVGPEGQPVPRAHVGLRRKGRGFGGFTEAKDGTFLRGPIGGDVEGYEVFGAAEADQTPLPFGPTTWVPKAGDEDVVTLPRGKTIAGVVVDAQGNGVFGAEVAAADPAAMPGGGTVGRALSDAQGRFAIVNLGEGPYRVQATPLPPFLPSEAVSSSVDGKDLRLTVAAGLEADVLVLDLDGKPVKGAYVGIASLGPPGGRGNGQVTDATGHARLSQLPPGGAYALAVSSARKDLSPYRQENWQPKDTTVRLSRAWVVRGTVHRADGSTAVSFVQRRTPDGRWLPTPTKKDGTFELRLSEAGPWVLAGSSAFNGPRGPEVTVTDPALPLTLEAPAAPAAPAPTPAR